MVTVLKTQNLESLVFGAANTRARMYLTPIVATELRRESFSHVCYVEI